MRIRKTPEAGSGSKLFLNNYLKCRHVENFEHQLDLLCVSKRSLKIFKNLDAGSKPIPLRFESTTLLRAYCTRTIYIPETTGSFPNADFSSVSMLLPSRLRILNIKMHNSISNLIRYSFSNLILFLKNFFPINYSFSHLKVGTGIHSSNLVLFFQI